MAIDIAYTLGNRGVARFETVDLGQDTAAAYRPVVNDPATIIANDGTTLLFDGTILTVGDSPVSAPHLGVNMAVQATDYTRVCDARILVGVRFNSQTLKQIVTAIRDTYLWSFSIVVDPSMADGPTFDVVTFDRVNVTEAFNRLSADTGYVWRITPDRVLEFFAVGTKAASYSLTSTNGKIVGAVTWQKTLSQRTNRIFLEYGSDRQVVKTETFAAATSGQTTWTLTYPAVGVNLRGYITVNGAFIPISTYGVHDAAAHPWQWDAATNSIKRTPGATAGDIVSVTYDAQFPNMLTVEDASAAIEPWEEIKTAPDVYDIEEATVIANGLLRRYKDAARTLTIRTREGLTLPGDTITLTIPERTVTGTWLVTAVRIRSNKASQFEYDLTCVEGTEKSDSWIDQFKSLVGGGGSGGTSGASTSTILPALTGQFEGVVTSHDAATSGHALMGFVPSTDSLTGGMGVQLFTSEFNHWAIVAEPGSSPSRRLTFQDRRDTSLPYVLRLGLDGSTYRLEPHALATLDIGEDSLGRRVNAIHLTSATSVNGYKERGRSLAMGEYKQVTPFSAANFTGLGTMTWTVASGDVATYQYRIIGDSMLVNFDITGGTVGGTPTTELLIDIPDGFIANKAKSSFCRVLNNAIGLVSVCAVAAAGTKIRIFADGTFATNWTAGAVSVRGGIEFEVQ